MQSIRRLIIKDLRYGVWGLLPSVLHNLGKRWRMQASLGYIVRSYLSCES